MTQSGTGERAPLDENERKELLRIARVSLKEWLRSGRLPPGAPHRRTLLEPSGAHVVLRLGEAERALGRITPEKPLYLTVAELVIGAGTRDPSLTLSDVPNVRFELAVISPPQRLPSPPDGLEVGRHGLAVKRQDVMHFHLPQQAGDGWDGTRFLAETCRAAGLAEEAWRDGVTEVLVFQAEVFGE